MRYSLFCLPRKVKINGMKSFKVFEPLSETYESDASNVCAT